MFFLKYFSFCPPLMQINMFLFLMDGQLAFLVLEEKKRKEKNIVFLPSCDGGHWKKYFFKHLFIISEWILFNVLVTS